MANKPQRPDSNSTENRDGITQSQQVQRRRRRGASDKADWANADAEQLLRAIVAVTGQNCAIQFGYTTDGGSLVVRIVGDGQPYNEYIRPSESLSDYLNAVTMDFAK